MSQRKKSAVRTAIRELVGLEKTQRNVPVILINGESGPELRGEQGGWFTKTGQKIYHPSAYTAIAWSNADYVCDTRRIIVGADWVTIKFGVNLDDQYQRKNRPYYTRDLEEKKRIMEKGSVQTSLDHHNANRASS